jgi:hypothetical protein
MKVLRQTWQPAGKMGVGNLGQAKFGHATFSRPDCIICGRRNGDNTCNAVIRETG